MALTATAGAVSDEVNDTTSDVSAATVSLGASSGIGQGSNGALDVNVNTVTSAQTASMKAGPSHPSP